MKSLAAALLIGSLSLATQPAAAGADAQARYQRGQQLYDDGDYLKASRYFFSVYTDPSGWGDRGEVLGLITDSLVKGNYPQTASYFFIKALQSGSRVGVRRALRSMPRILDAVGGDVLKSYVLAHTREDDYEGETRDHFFYFIGKDKLLKGDATGALDALKKVSGGSSVGPAAAQLRGTAHAILGQPQQAVEWFRNCERSAGRLRGGDSDDLEHRCLAGRARSLYQMGRHDDAEEVYDDIPKKSFVWTDILFEQAWNSYAKGDYNRALGKLVTYRSPHLKFVFNPETDVLRAQSFLALCLYDDANKTINDFNETYQAVGRRLKEELQRNSSNYGHLFAMGKDAYRSKLHGGDMMRRALNRSVRGPHFAAMLRMESAAMNEAARLRAAMGDRGGYPDFLAKVAGWRVKTVRLLGGIFVRNSMVDLYGELLANLDKMSFIKSEMLSQMKGRVERRNQLTADEDGKMKRGSSGFDRKDYQYYWGFNGEFWNDELGDYVFALESECR